MGDVGLAYGQVHAAARRMGGMRAEPSFVVPAFRSGGGSPSIGAAAMEFLAEWSDFMHEVDETLLHGAEMIDKSADSFEQTEEDLERLSDTMMEGLGKSL